MQRRRYESPRVESSGAVGEAVPAQPSGRDLTADEFARGGDLEQAFASHEKLKNGGRQVKKSPKDWAESFSAWKQRELS